MMAHFKSLNQISNCSLPMKPAYHLLPSSKNDLLFPGKLTISSFEEKTKLVISDSGNNRIIITDEHGKVEQIVGGPSQGFKNGDFKSARFNSPQGVCVIDNIIYVADNNNHVIRKVRKRTFIIIIAKLLMILFIFFKFLFLYTYIDRYVQESCIYCSWYWFTRL